MSEIINIAIQRVQCSLSAWCRYITGNDTGRTGAHQAGFYIPKCASSLLFDKPGIKGENKERIVTIKWQNDFYTNSAFKYYGKGSRNEYRVTRFGKNFPFLSDNNVGDLLIIAKFSNDDYEGFVLSEDDDIDIFFATFNLSPNKTNQLINNNKEYASELDYLISEYSSRFIDFPSTKEMSKGARWCYNNAFNVTSELIQKKPDDVLLNWVDTEYVLFKILEEKIYKNLISKPFESVDLFVKSANEILNRRKSRAGKSLEHHLSSIFTQNELIFEEQAITEVNKKPDFLFPNGFCYHNLQFPADELTVLGVKTTCKDRWRQVLTEAERAEHKYLFTLQQGISKNQLAEMRESNLTLVVPSKYISSFPKEYQDDIKSLIKFIQIVKTKQDSIPRHFLMS